MQSELALRYCEVIANPWLEMAAAHPSRQSDWRLPNLSSMHR
jgi:hypothetical protein